MYYLSNTFGVGGWVWGEELKEIKYKEKRNDVHHAVATIYILVSHK